MKNLKGRVAVVTGAASGIGRATSVALAREGCDLAITDVNEAGLKETAKMIAALGRKVSTHVVDVASKSQMKALPKAVIAEHGHVHIVVNNAGVSVTAPFEHHSIEDFEWIMGINLWGVVYGCKFFLPYIQKEDEGHIVNISSVFGIIGLPSQSSYAATKFAVRGFSESLRTELAPQHIGVTSIHPGGVNTNIVKSSRFVDAQETGAKRKIEKMFEQRAISPDEAAKEIVDGIKKNKARVLITRESHVIDTFKRLFPVGTNRMVEFFQERMGMGI
ncbi:MAG: SDR family NAD(P)-dependent oxidoreductase [Chrysiogenetes bacterium]|nr:SDR family NAD(P)-dependent oxidoreductase [Chrysiogenetes bacterium]